MTTAAVMQSIMLMAWVPKTRSTKCFLPSRLLWQHTFPVLPLIGR
jgi:hypothetical protein